jgi:hypothetical protein
MTLDLLKLETIIVTNDVVLFHQPLSRLSCGISSRKAPPFPSVTLIIVAGCINRLGPHEEICIIHH